MCFAHVWSSAIKLSALKWLWSGSLTARGFPYTALTGKVLVFWIGGCLWEVVGYEGWSHKEVLLYSLYHLPPCSFLPSHSDTPHPTKKCGMIHLTPWQKLLFFYCFSNSWSLMSHCYMVKFLLNRPASICIKFRFGNEAYGEYINVKQKKSSWGSEMNNTFFWFYSHKPRSQVWSIM